jgi:hypothetical protein
MCRYRGDSMKTCSKCGLVKSDAEFYKDKSKSDGLASACKSCRNAILWEYRRSHPDIVAARQEKFKREHPNYYAEWAKDNYHNNPGAKERIRFNKQTRMRELGLVKERCAKCGEQRYHLLDYHHIDPNLKSFSLVEYNKHTREEIESEIKKCVVLCSNCHRDFHYLYGHDIKHPVESLHEYLCTDKRD